MAKILCQQATDEQIQAALNRCLRECQRYPVRMPDILQRIPGAGVDDGRPGPEEAWAMIPKTEDGSIVWTAEMREAYASARQLIRDGDLIGARMTFKEIYPRLVDTARRNGVRIAWEASLGWDKADRVRVLADAVTKKRMSSDAALTLLAPEQQAELAGLLPEPERLKLPGEVTREAKPIRLHGFAGVLQRIRMDGLVPDGCDPGPPKPVREPLGPDEIRRRRKLLREQAEFIRKGRAAEEKSA
jgi:hypothetical protein